MDLLHQNLLFFTQNQALADIIVRSLDHDSALRPPVKRIQEVVNAVSDQIRQNKITGASHSSVSGSYSLKLLINEAIKGLTVEPMAVANNLWYSRVRTQDNSQDQRLDFEKTGGLSEGVAGVQYFLARAKKCGFDIDLCRKMYDKSWKFILNSYLKSLPDIPPGLYGGAAGIALATKTGIEAGLIENSRENIQYIAKCLELPSVGLDVASGASGQAIATLQCLSFLDRPSSDKILEGHLNSIMEMTFKDGLWIRIKSDKKNSAPATSFAYGNTGITWFLLEYAETFHHQEVRNIAIRALRSLEKLVRPMLDGVKKEGLNSLLVGKGSVWDGLNGLILTFLKGFETIKDPYYMTLAEKLLQSYPENVAHENLNQDIGLAGLGEVYLEAYRVSREEKWLVRSAWIAEFLRHTVIQSPPSTSYWISNNQQMPTADFLVGNSGIIHFLMRHSMPGQLGYRFLK